MPDTILPGEHNKRNVRLAATVAELFVSPSAINDALLKFQPLPHRLELVGKFKDILFYDDAISTAPESTIAAIKALCDVDTIFLGGEDRGYDFSQYIVCVNLTGTSNDLQFEGGLMVTDPKGNVLYENYDREEKMAVVTLNNEKINKIRNKDSKVNYIARRQVELYRL